MQRTELAQSIMDKFSVETGFTNQAQQNIKTKTRRYLWTDAFAVCNYVGYYRQTHNPQFLQRALQLVEQVHSTLGKHRVDSNQVGWISGLNEQQATLHPTRGGLRIGKPLDDRQSDTADDQALQWHQDGQYFHYLTKWMHALYCVGRATDNCKYDLWAMELAKTASAAFVRKDSQGSKKTLYWKMSIDLSRPMVMSMGQHDPLDGLLTYLQLQANWKKWVDPPTELTLDQEIAEMASICTGQRWRCDDPLGIGGLLCEAYKLMQLNTMFQANQTLRLQDVLDDIEFSLHAYISQNPFNLRAEQRLPFRELGLAIGLQCIPKMQKLLNQRPKYFKALTGLEEQLNNLGAFYPLYQIIEQFWLKPKHQIPTTWQHHADINNVMLATSLSPDGYLQL